MDIRLFYSRLLHRRCLHLLCSWSCLVWCVNRSFRIVPVKRHRLPHSSTRSGSSIQIPDARGVIQERSKMCLVENEEAEANLVFPWVSSCISIAVPPSCIHSSWRRYICHSLKLKPWLQFS
ncbi:hypothetical protein BDR04DRAFT_733372 [Suillus decipiens]|nr:hypothetical protein BDR04DRAFT_733372 [Suillus decipiens]